MNTITVGCAENKEAVAVKDGAVYNIMWNNLAGSDIAYNPPFKRQRSRVACRSLINLCFSEAQCLLYDISDQGDRTVYFSL